MAAAAVFTGETLPQKCPFGSSEGRIVPCRVGVRVKRSETGRTVLMLSPSSSSSSPLPLHVHKTHTHTHTCKHARRRSTPTCCLCRAQLATLSSALRGRAWRQESGEIEAEEEDEEVEEDVYDEGRKKIERLKECIPC